MASKTAKRKPILPLTMELLSAALNSSNEAIVIKDCEGTILIGSQSIADFYRCSVEELPGRDAYGAIPEEFPKELAEIIRRKDLAVIESGIAVSGEETWDLIYELRTLLVSRSPIKDPDGTCIGLITCYKNISAIRQAFRLFEQNEQRFTALAHTCPVGIFECNPSSQITYVNPEWERITGLSAEQAKGKQWTAFVADEHRHLLAPLIGRRDSRTAGDRIDCVLRGGRECTVELSLNRVADTHNNTVSYIGSIVDLTFRLQAQQELRQKSNLMRDLTSSVPAIIWQLDLDGELIFVSDYWETLTGKAIRSALGIGWRSCVHPDDLPTVNANLGSLLQGQAESVRYELRLQGRDGDWRWMLAQCQQIHGIDGRFIGVAGQAIDITERRQAEMELQQYSHRLEERVEARTLELVAVNESLRTEIANRQHAQELLDRKQAELAHFSRVSVMGRLSGELAHELNQPLNAIRNYIASLSKILSESQAANTTSDVLARLNGEITRAAGIIKRTRDFVSPGRHQPERLSIATLISDTVAMLKGDARRRGMSIQVIESQDNLQALGDPIRLQQVLVNLILNAFDAMTDQPSSNRTVTIEMNRIADKSVISVNDTGGGVPETEMTRLFDAFFTTKPSGLGMGLAISRGIVEDHGGTLTYHVGSSSGSSFVITLPKLLTTH